MSGSRKFLHAKRQCSVFQVIPGTICSARASSRHLVRRAFTLIGFGCAIVARPAAVALADSPARVRFTVVRDTGAETCPDLDGVSREVASRLGREPFDPNATSSIDVTLARSAGEWTARILLRAGPDAPTRTRTLRSDAPDCSRLLDSVALTVALAIDPNASLTRPANAGAPSSTDQAPMSAVAQPVAVAAAALTAHAPCPLFPDAWATTDRADVRAMILLGPLPRATFALAVGADTDRAGPWRASVGVLRSAQSVTDDGRYAFSLTALWALGCFGRANSRLGGDLCAGAMGGVVNGAIRAATEAPVAPGDYPWLALVASLRASVRLADSAVFELGVEPHLALVRQRFIVEGGPVIFEQVIAGLALYAGVRLRLW